MPKQSIAGNKNLAEAFLTVGMGLVGDAMLPLNGADYWMQKNVKFSRHQFWHAQSISATVANQSVSFFNAAPDFVSAFYTGPNTIVGGQSAFWLCHPTVEIISGYQPGGTAEADGEPFQTDVDPATVVADLHALYKFGQLRMKIGSKWDKRYRGLHHFPPGAGLDGFGFGSNTNTTTINQLAVANNGSPNNANKAAMTPPLEIYPDDAVEITLQWPFARTLKDAYTVVVTLEGVLVEVG